MSTHWFCLLIVASLVLDVLLCELYAFDLETLWCCQHVYFIKQIQKLARKFNVYLKKAQKNLHSSPKKVSWYTYDLCWLYESEGVVNTKRAPSSNLKKFELTCPKGLTDNDYFKNRG